ncbi:type I-E CRISPR-associated protein Cse2/CasB [Streptomyces sp. NRRL F-5630]|uniref:type I-E CRISPR-associated protein Cse2/CasB n=1 Tax=Streptomyces sp. NRRL F-5630 TaxID=1463864 RepID=UPI0004C57FB2|nr:type I-E CRISPR-associated protein Cse2/CasB [Streptomyces sp. NRRL F-5630]
MTSSPPAPAPSADARPAPRLGPVGSAVHQHIKALQSRYLKDQSDAVAALARLRRGVGRAPGEVPDLWGLTGTEPLYERYAQGTFSEEEFLRAEEAAHTAVTLWSLHQQSHHVSRMHRRPGPELGTAVRRLTPGAAIDEPTRRRFVRAGTAATPVVLATRLRELVLLLRREEIPLDYGLLADQLHRWTLPGGAQGVRRSWGRSYLVLAKPATPASNSGEDHQPLDPITTEDDTP